MSNQPKYGVAVIIPALNEELFIERCIQSALAQSYPVADMEIVVVDGGSTDRTCVIVRALSAVHTNIRLLSNPRRLRSAAFNVGVSQSDAPYIICMDAHVTYDACYVERCVELLKAHPEYGTVGGVCEILPQNNSLIARANALLNHLRFGIGGASFRVGSEAKAVDSVPFGAFRREVVNEIGYMREEAGRAEDNDYNFRIRQAGYLVWLDPAIRSSYYARATWGSSCRQMYANGVAIGNLFYISPQAIGLRHLVPLMFVLSLLATAVSACFTVYGLFALAAIFGAYVLAALVADIAACSRYGWNYVFVLPPLFLSVHLSYGVGTLVGLVKRN